MADSRELEPPPQTHVEDPGAHQLAEASDSEDQFTDAQSAPTSPGVSSPVPKTRVERVDTEPSYGEVPGTGAYQKREQDAEPDEIAVIAGDAPESSPSAPPEPGTVPITVVEESTGEYPGQHSSEEQEKHKADATPDIILSPNGEIRNGNEDAIDDFGDDFDDFEEGGHDDDFDDFEDGFQHAQPTEATTSVPPPIQPQLSLPFSIPDFDGLSPDEVISAIEPCLPSLFPPEELDFPAFPQLPKDSSIFLTPRSASLWSQLVAPPPLAPPDWIRSRTRRLFLVSLGVPVDLDEILPASKQKKLVLPSLNIPATSPRGSSDLRSTARLRQEDGNASSTSIDSQGKPSTSKRRKGPPPQPELDLVQAKHLCQTTDEALNGMTDEELKQHVAKLEAMQGVAKEVLEYWTKRTDEKIGDREAFEGVIENLVAHARKVRK
ncbi:hypothetical protein BBK36DRAFT_1135728 [Trichoderma citrinoviride]|uniref:Uncharacterized protein n=1 Tax=Trichoderma citrinoviride TaxID=58853 RepID=A0A2T4B7K6_9HYPO|nr:hypothetical protein BBK36DRAFT_1135728 [Trichoderma citrinoviride]PTB65305.1 hypothetical protein BBK36DRAFT_1135728 [Trichoderma citrinoviride]